MIKRTPYHIWSTALKIEPDRSLLAIIQRLFKLANDSGLQGTKLTDPRFDFVDSLDPLNQMTYISCYIEENIKDEPSILDSADKETP